MSLLFESAIAEFDGASAGLYSPRDEELAVVREEPIPVEGIVEFARHHEALVDGDRVVVPLHERGSAELSGEYLAFKDDQLRGEVFVYAGRDEQESIDRISFGKSALADRVKFWHSDYAPPVEPSYFSSPIAEREPARNPVPDPDAFFDELASFVRAERDAQREANLQRIADSTPGELHADGFGAIPSLTSYGRPEDGIFWFNIDEDEESGCESVQSEYDIFERNSVLVHVADAGEVPDAFPVRATVDSVRAMTVGVAVDWQSVDDMAGVRSFLSRTDREFAVTRLLNPVPYDRELEAIERVRGREEFRALLTGDVPVTFGDTAGVESSQHDVALNQEQELAASCALLADQLFCIHGPPGTGKTRTLVEIVRRSAQAGNDVLVCADSNQAVDNLVAGASTDSAVDERSLHAYAQHGAEEFVLRRVKAGNSMNEVVQAEYATQNGRADVVAATNNSAAILDREFDVLVLDEATQATCTASCIPLARAEKVVLAGDHKQLPPFSATEAPPESAAGMSLFEHLYADGGVYEGVGIQLRTQYRMHRDIAWFSNQRFYDRALQHGRDVAAFDDRPAIRGYDIGGTEARVENSTRNDAEARLVAHVVGELLAEEPVAASDVGVITPYAAQVEAIQTKLAAQLDHGGDVAVDTIDSFQGSEKSAIVISLVRSNGAGDIGFLGRPLDGARRLNVALTRAQRFCAVIGDWYTLRSTQEDTDKNAALYEDLYSYLENTGRLQQVEPEFIPVP